MEPNNQKQESMAQQPQHETSVPAIVTLLVLAAVLVTVVASGGSSVDFGGQATQPAAEISRDSEAVSYENTQPVDTFSDLPSGLMNGQVNVVQNRQVDLGNRQQRVVVFNSNMSLDDASKAYREWVQNGDYSLENVSLNQGSQSITASNGGDELIIMLNENSNSQSRVQLSYIKPTGE
jgi:hypothetical protein